MISNIAMARLDLSAQTSFRSHPSVGGEVEIEAGYNQLLYGSGPGDAGKNVLYGLARPSVALASSGVINAAKAKFELYPVSFLGVVVGHETIQSDYNEFTFFDCENEVRCTGEIKRDYVQGRMALGAGPVVVSALVEESRNSYSADKEGARPPGEFRFVVLANPEFDNHYRSQYVLGFKTSFGTLAAITEYVYFKESKTYNRMNLIGLTAKFARTYNWVLGAGSFESSEIDPGGIVVFQFKYSFAPSDKLF